MEKEKAAEPKRTGTQMQRIDAGYATYLKRRAKKEKCTVVDLTATMLKAIRQTKPKPKKPAEAE